MATASGWWSRVKVATQAAIASRARLGLGVVSGRQVVLVEAAYAAQPQSHQRFLAGGEAVEVDPLGAPCRPAMAPIVTSARD
jgi:hypothetical protein